MSSRRQRERPEGLTIDELAARTGIPSRTIRFYQSKGALQKPQRAGRLALYGEEHVQRLKQIAQLQDRGLSIRAIRDLFQRIDKGELSLNDWLGLEAQLQAPWVDDEPRLADEREIYELIGEQRPGLIAELERAGIIRRQKDRFLIRSPRLLQIAGELERNGVALHAAVGAAEIIEKHVSRMARDLLDFYLRRVGKDFAGDASPESIQRALAALRPLGIEAVGLLFGQAMEASLRELIASGRLAELRVARKTPRRKDGDASAED